MSQNFKAKKSTVVHEFVLRSKRATYLPSRLTAYSNSLTTANLTDDTVGGSWWQLDITVNLLFSKS